MPKPRRLPPRKPRPRSSPPNLATLQSQIDEQAGSQKAQLDELENAIVEAESIIPENLRDRYKRTVKQRGADAMAAVDYDQKSRTGACSGCFVAVTTQMMTELVKNVTMTFCMTCGRILYLAEEDHNNTRRTIS